MQANNANYLELFIALWFAVSVASALIGNFVFMYWLKRQGAKLDISRIGIPFYLDRVYITWRRSQGRKPNKTLFVVRVFSFLNAIAAGVFFILFVAK